MYRRLIAGFLLLALPAGRGSGESSTQPLIWWTTHALVKVRGRKDLSHLSEKTFHRAHKAACLADPNPPPQETSPDPLGV